MLRIIPYRVRTEYAVRSILEFNINSKISTKYTHLLHSLFKKCFLEDFFPKRGDQISIDTQSKYLSIVITCWHIIDVKQGRIYTRHKHCNEFVLEFYF
jgi:hypothetical protein